VGGVESPPAQLCKKQLREICQMMRTPTPTGSIIAVALCLYNIPALAQPLQLTPPQFIAQQSPEEEADAIYKQAVELSNKGSVEAAITEFKKAASMYEQMGELSKQATSLMGIGLTYFYMGEKQQALDYYNQALTLYRSAGDSTGESTALNNIYQIRSELGNNLQVLENQNDALPPSQSEEVTSENLCGLGDAAIGTFGIPGMLDPLTLAAAQVNLNEAEMSFALGIFAMMNRDGIYTPEAGTPESLQCVLSYFEKALTSYEQTDNKAMQAFSLSIVASYSQALGKTQQALDYYKKALSLYQDLGDRRLEAHILLDIGEFYYDLGEQQQALDYCEKALLLFESIDDQMGQASALRFIGKIYDDSGEQQQALDYYEKAVPLFEQGGGDWIEEANTLSDIASIEFSSGNLSKALTHIKSVIDQIEYVRSYSNSQTENITPNFHDSYLLYIDILMQLHKQDPSQGYDSEALHISESARARGLLKLLVEANVDIRQGVDPKLLEKEKKLREQLNTLEHAKHQLLSGQYDQAEIDRIKEQSKDTLRYLRQLEDQISFNSPAYADLKYPEPLTLAEIQQQVLDEETLLLEYSLGKERSYLWAVTTDSINSYELPSQQEIEAAAETFRKSVTVDSGASLEAGIALSEIVLSPVIDQLENKRLLIVGDGVLQYVPFAALPLPNSPTTPLLVQNEIVTLSSASTVAIQRQQLQNRSLAAKKLAVLADPVFSENDERFTGIATEADESLSRSAMTRAARNLGLENYITPTFSRLKYTRIEADAILALVPETQQMKAFDFEASRTMATDPNLADYQIVHLATHGLLDPVNPELSGVVLSLLDENGENQNGFLRLNDIFNLNLPAELVVLSACKTGLGENIRGEGLVGLTRGFMYAGARRVVVSLWSVDDLATSEVMARFYQKMLNEELNPVVALREAQLEMWNSGQWQSPYYWAAFTIQGDWQN